jgi:hypothetical protein
MRRLLIGLSFALVLGSVGSVGQAQVWSLEDMIQAGIRQCMSQHMGDPDAPRFCNCMVRRWVGLWNEYDSESWRRTGVPTRHMQEMEAEAARQCSRG